MVSRVKPVIIIGTPPSVLTSSYLLVLLACLSTTVLSTNAPVIGILAQEYSHHSSFVAAFPNHTSYIAASYVKLVESSGARVVPILIGQDREYYADLLSQINGVLLPGGGTHFNESDGYADAGRHIIHLASILNRQGERVPILAVCLGFELLLQVSALDTDFRTRCKVQQVNLNLKFLPGFESSSLFGQAPAELVLKLAKKPLTHNNHIWCITFEDMVAHNLTDEWNVLSMSKYNSWDFVSTVEHKTYPLVGLQFHPEKNAFEWTGSQHNPHYHDAITSARIFSDWLIMKARLNNRSFSSRDMLYRSLIQNYDHAIVYPHSLGFEQMYLFK